LLLGLPAYFMPRWASLSYGLCEHLSELCLRPSSLLTTTLTSNGFPWCQGSVLQHQ
jgi:hypothetical protein